MIGDSGSDYWKPGVGDALQREYLELTAARRQRSVRTWRTLPYLWIINIGAAFCRWGEDRLWNCLPDKYRPTAMLCGSRFYYVMPEESYRDMAEALREKRAKEIHDRAMDRLIEGRRFTVSEPEEET